MLKIVNKIGLKKYRPWIALFLMFILVTLFLRSPYVSNWLKMEILSGLQNATGKQVITRKIYVNLLPFFIGFNDMRAFNQDGSKVADIQQVKAYIDPFKLFIRTIDLERLVISGADIYLNNAEIDDMKNRFGGEGGGGGLFRFKLAKVVLQGSDIEYRDDSGAVLLSQGTDAELSLNKKYLGLEYDSDDIRVSGLSESHNIPDMDFALSFIARMRADELELDKLEYERRGTLIAGQGVMSPLDGSQWKKFELRLDASVAIESLRDLFALKTDTTGVVNAKGTLAFDPKSEQYTVDFRLSGDMNLESLMELIMRDHGDNHLAGHMEFDGALKGPLNDLVGSAEASITNGYFYGVSLQRGRCRVDYDDHLLKFSKGKADIYNGKADVFVSVTIPGGAPFAVDVDFNNADSAPLFELIGIEAFGFSNGKVEGSFHTAGMQLSPRGRAIFTSGGKGDLPTARVRRMYGDYDTDEAQRLHLKGFKAETAHSSIAFDGYIGLQSHEISFTGALATSAVSDLLVPSFPRVDGEASLKATVTGSTHDPMVSGVAEFSALETLGYGIGNGTLGVAYTKDRLEMTMAAALPGQSSHAASGRIDFRDAKHLFDLSSPSYLLNATAVSGDLGALISATTGRPVDVTGKYDADIAIRGTQTRPRVEGKLHAWDALAYGRRIDRADMSVKYADGWLELGGVDALSGVSSLHADFRVSGEGGYEFKAHSDRAMLGLAHMGALPIDYAVKFDAEGSGTFDSPRVSLRGTLSDGRYEMRPVGGGKVELALDDRELKVRADLLDGKLSAVGSALLGANYPWDIDMRLGFDRYEYLLKSHLSNAPSDLTIGAEGSIHAWGNRTEYNASFDLKRLNVFMYEQGYSNIDDVRFNLHDRRIDISKLVMQSGTASLDASGFMDFAGEMSMKLKGGSSLMPLRMLTGKVVVEKGDAEFDIDLNGTLESPVIDGRIRIVESTVSFPGIVQKLSGINGTISFADSRATLESVRASIGGGTIEVAGTVDHEGYEIRSINIESVIRDVSAYLTKGFVANVDGNVMFAGTADSQELLGELHLNRARYDKRIDWKSWLLSGARALQPTEKAAWMERVGLNVRLSGEESIRVDNNLARANLKLDIFARGTLASPVLYGKVESDEGKVYFRNSEFDIIKATADYSDIDISGPYVDIQARTSVKGYRIWLSLEGRADQMDMTLTSDPPLDDVDILALLTLGDYGENLSGLEGGISAAEATSFLTGKIQDVVEERFRLITGIDRFQIDPYVSRTTSTVTPRVTLSKRLAGDSVFVTYSSTLDAVAEQEFKLEYLLNENVSVLAGQDYTGSMGGDVKIRFSFK